MADDKQDELIRAYARLSALRKNISEMKENNIEEIYVLEYHGVLDKLLSIGRDVAEFRVSDSSVKPIISSISSNVYGETRVKYSTEKYVKRALLLMKLDAVLGYFEITMAEKPKNIGFRT